MRLRGIGAAADQCGSGSSSGRRGIGATLGRIDAGEVEGWLGIGEAARLQDVVASLRRHCCVGETGRRGYVRASSVQRGVVRAAGHHQGGELSWHRGVKA